MLQALHLKEPLNYVCLSLPASAHLTPRDISCLPDANACVPPRTDTDSLYVWTEQLVLICLGTGD